MSRSSDNASAASFRQQARYCRPQFGDTGCTARGGRDNRGEGGWPPRERCFDFGNAGTELGRFHLVAFGQDDLMTDSGLAEDIECRLVSRFEAVACIHQNIHAREAAPPPQTRL